jgi:methionine-rich copper-binding protein CopC
VTRGINRRKHNEEEINQMNRRTCVVPVLALLLSLGLFSIASAHAKLVSSNPAAGAKLTTAPSKVTLVFSEEISDKANESYVTVTDEQGSEVGKGGLDNTDLDHKTQSVTLKTGLGDGVYTVKWNALTPDDNGHSEGSFNFGVNKDPGAQPTAAPEPTEGAEATATPAAAGGAAQPTAKPTTAPTAAAGAANPGTLPRTGAGEAGASRYFLFAAILVLLSGFALRRVIAHTRR